MKDKKKQLDELKSKPTTSPEGLSRVENSIDIIHLLNEFPLNGEELELLHKLN